MRIIRRAVILTHGQLSQVIILLPLGISITIVGIIGLTLKFKAKEVEIYKNGKLIETARYDGSKLVYTGNNVNAVLVVSSVVVIALVAGFALRKKFANA